MLALMHAWIHPVTGSPVRDGVILVDNRKIVDMGEGLVVPPEAEVLDCKGLRAYPGFIDANTRLGIHEVVSGEMGYDEDEVPLAMAPHLRVIDAVNPKDRGVREALEAGITTAMVTPGTFGVVGGQACVIKTYGDLVDDMLLRAPAAMAVSLTGTPRMAYMRQGMTPRDRTQDIATFRQELFKVRALMERSTKARGKSGADETAQETKVGGGDMRQEALALVLERAFPALINAQSSVDVRNAIRLSQEFGFDVVLANALEPHLMVDEIKASGFPVIMGPLTVGRRGGETRNFTLKAPGILHRAGIPVALTTGFPGRPPKYVMAHAALAVREGMPREAALESITLTAAKILGVSDRVGSLEKGKDADIVLMTSDPFDVWSRVKAVFVDGRKVVSYEGGV